MYGESSEEVRKIEARFAGFNETNLLAGKRDRCMQEVWLCENVVAMQKFPLMRLRKSGAKLTCLH